MGREKGERVYLIHNYHTVPADLLSYGEPYVLYDASDDDGGQTRLRLGEAGIAYTPLANTGHNLTTWCRYFADQYEVLPEIILLLKGNLIGRHCSKEYFERVRQNTWFTYLYEERGKEDRYAKRTAADTAPGAAFWATESQFAEINNSWYVRSPNHPHRYFDCYDDLLRFVYADPVIPRYCLFAPGGCYILRREQVYLHGPAFYRNLSRLMDYGTGGDFPSEAYQVERMLPVIFEMRYRVNPWMEEDDAFRRKLEQREALMREKDAEQAAKEQAALERLQKGPLGKARRALGAVRRAVRSGKG